MYLNPCARFLKLVNYNKIIHIVFNVKFIIDDRDLCSCSLLDNLLQFSNVSIAEHGGSASAMFLL